jgi:hypothetical protein
MTRTSVMASSRPQATVDRTTTRSVSSRARRGLAILPVVIALGLAPVAPALGATGTSGYGEKPPTPTTKPNSGTSPSKSTKTPTTTPANEVAPTTESAPATSTQPAKASTLPFTGFDLRWTVGAGLLLLGAGGSIMVMQRRQRRDDAGL